MYDMLLPTRINIFQCQPETLVVTVNPLAPGAFSPIIVICNSSVCSDTAILAKTTLLVVS